MIKYEIIADQIMENTHIFGYLRFSNSHFQFQWTNFSIMVTRPFGEPLFQKYTGLVKTCLDSEFWNVYKKKK